MEQYLKAYINYLQNNWLNRLAMSKFIGNNTKSRTTKLTSFFANKGFHPCMRFKLIELTNANFNKLNANIFTH